MAANNGQGNPVAAQALREYFENPEQLSDKTPDAPQDLINEFSELLGQPDGETLPPKAEQPQQPAEPEPSADGFDDLLAKADDDLPEQPADSSTESTPDDDAQGEKPEAIPLAKLAKILGTTVDVLYDRLLIPDSGERPAFRLGQLKDLHQDDARMAERERKVQDERIALENEVLRRRSEFQQLMNLVPEVSPELHQQAAANAQQLAAREIDAARAVITEWQDDKRREADFAEIAKEMLEPRGLSIADLNYVASTNHKWLKFIRDANVMRKQLATADAQMRRDAKKANKAVTNSPSVRARGTQQPDQANPDIRQQFAALLR